PFERKRYWVEPAGLDPRESSADTNGPGRPAQSEVRAEAKNPATGKPPLNMPGFTAKVDQTLAALKGLFQALSGLDLSCASAAATFVELGFDSLFLTQAAQAVQNQFGVGVTFRQLLEEFPTLEKLAAHL